MSPRERHIYARGAYVAVETSPGCVLVYEVRYSTLRGLVGSATSREAAVRMVDELAEYRRAGHGALTGC